MLWWFWFSRALVGALRCCGGLEFGKALGGSQRIGAVMVLVLAKVLAVRRPLVWLLWFCYCKPVVGAHRCCNDFWFWIDLSARRCCFVFFRYREKPLVRIDACGGLGVGNLSEARALVLWGFIVIRLFYFRLVDCFVRIPYRRISYRRRAKQNLAPGIFRCEHMLYEVIRTNDGPKSHVSPHVFTRYLVMI